MRLALIKAVAFLVLLGTLCSCAKKTPTLSLLVWEGYADPSFVHEFEQKYHCKVSASYMGSSDELVAKLRGGSASNYDVDLSLERCRYFDRDCWPGRTSRSVEDTFVQSALACPHFPHRGEIWTGRRMAFHSCGDRIRSSMIRAFSLRRPIAGAFYGIRSIVARSLFGTISPRFTWPRSYSATTNPIRAHLYNLSDAQLATVKAEAA